MQAGQAVVGSHGGHAILGLHSVPEPVVGMRRGVVIAEGDQGPEFMRHLLLAGALLTRLAFDVYAVPKQRAHRIGEVRL